MNDFSRLEREGCRSLRSALASIWRMRSRVTSKSWPTSSRVWSLFSPMPKRIRSTFSSRGVRVASTLRVCSARFMLMTASEGETRLLSSMKSPRCESSSSPMGVSSQLGLGALCLALADADGVEVAAQGLHREVGLLLHALDLPHRRAHVPLHGLQLLRGDVEPPLQLLRADRVVPGLAQRLAQLAHGH